MGLNPGEEVVALVDEHNRVIGSTTRAQMRAQRLVHRATYTFVFARDGRLFLQRRTEEKDMYPGYWDAAAGGVLLAGESYDESARREAAEELGIDGVPLEGLFDFYYEDEANRVWGRVYSCVFEGPFRLQAEEVAEGRFVEVADLLAGLYQPLTPDTLDALQRYVEYSGGRSASRP